MIIREATAEDAGAICAIWNPIIRSSVATFNSQTRTAETLALDLAAKSRHGHPFLVAETGGAIAGFATYGRFRGSNGYRHTMEHTIIVADAARGQGLGHKLMTAIEAHGRHNGVHSMFAGISGENTGGIAFHASIGYREVATLREVGRKFGRWFDLVLMQKML